MEAVERSPLRVLRLPLVGELRLDPGAISAWLLPVLLIPYLALNNGGYGTVEWGEVGIAIWWLVLVGTLLGALPVAGGTPAGRALLLLLALFAGYTALSLGWSESAERSATELARVATYLGVFALALAIQGQGLWRPMLAGITTAVALVCAIALLARIEPTWFPERVSGEFLPPEIERRLAYPFNYSTGLGIMASIGLPLALAATAGARTLVAQALAAAALPILALTLWLTSSGLAHVVAVAALVLFGILAPDRLPKLATLAIACGGAAILFAAVDQREALDQGLVNDAALQQGDELAVILAAVCLGVALAQTGIGIAARYGSRPGWMRVSPRNAIVASLVAAIALLTGAIAAGVPGEISDGWQRFKTPEGALTLTEARSSEILDVSSSGRYEFWRAAADAGAAEPLTGTGAGTFEYWWAREGERPQFVRDAHSLYLETFGELGVIGLLLIASFTVGIIAIGVAWLGRAPSELRLGLAAAVAACAAFLVGAALDWAWELSALPVTFLLLGAIVVAAGRDLPPRRTRSGRIAIVALSIAALFAIALPLAGAGQIDASRIAASRGELDVALKKAEDAAAAQPYAASPRLQEALLLELRGDLPGALAEARAAASKEDTNWRTWLVLSRLEARNGNAEAAVEAYGRMTALNPNSKLLEELGA